MNSDRARHGLLALQWVLGLVIFLRRFRFQYRTVRPRTCNQAAIFAFSPASAHAFAKTGLPSFVRLALAWAEMAAAIVFLIPRTTIAGGWLLLVVLAGAVVLHLLHGWLDVGGF